jgi:hypothetical protein
VLSRLFFRLAISLAAMLIALVASVIALGYFVYGLYLVLLGMVVPPAAAVLTGILVLLTALLLIAVLRAVMGRRRRRGRADSPEVWEDAAELGSNLGRKIRGLTGEHASGGLLAALVAGLAVGLSPKLRAFLQSILKP